MTALLVGSGQIKGVVMVLLVLHALRGPQQIIEAFTVGIFLTLNNQALGTGFAVLRWPLLFAAFARIVWELTRNRETLFRSATIPLLFTYALAAVAFAPLVSEYVSISVLKAVAFFLGTFTILTAFRLAPDHARVQSWLFTFYVYIVVGSIAALYLPAPMLGGLFKGLFNHPQAFGAFLIPFTAWAAFLLFTTDRRPAWLVGIVLLSFYWVYRTGSRTALLGILLTVTVSVIFMLLRGGEGTARVVAAIKALAFPMLLMLVLVVAFAGRQVMVSAQEFLAKGDQAENVGQAFEGSRGALINLQMANFRSSPIVGIGFGAPSEQGDLTIKRGGFLGLPTGASVEKGFLPSAVLEEMGVVGAVLLLLIVGSLLRAAWRQPDPALLPLLLGALLINAGEMIFFSPTALGVFMWLAIGLAITPYAPAGVPRYAHRAVYRKPGVLTRSESLQVG